MSVEEAKELLEILEEDISKLLMAFTKNTKLNINDIQMSSIKTVPNEVIKYLVNVDVKLK